MKKNNSLYMLVSIAVLGIITISCNRNDFANTGNVDYTKKQLLLDYLSEQKIIHPEASTFIDTMINKADWNNFSQINNSLSTVTLYYLPFNYSKNKVGITFMYYINKHKIYYSLITEFLMPKSKIKNNISNAPIDILYGFYNYKMKQSNYTGSIRAFNLSNDFIWQYGYENGIQQFETRITSYDPGDTLPNSQSNTTNVKWHLITMFEDGKYDWRYIGTTKENDDCEKSVGLTRDSIRIKTNYNVKSRANWNYYF
jgi:hypothetical protein